MIIWMDNEFKLQKVELFMMKGDHLVTTYKKSGAPPAGINLQFTPPADVHVLIAGK